MHIGIILTGVFRRMRVISSSVEGTIQYNHLDNSIATIASIMLIESNTVS